MGARDALQRFFEAVDDFTLHRIGRSTRVGNRNKQARVFDIGKLVDAQFVERHQPQGHDAQNNHHRSNRAADAEIR